MTFATILQDLYRRMRLQTATPPAGTVTRYKAFVNEVHRDLLTTPGISRLRDDVTAITIVASTARSGLPPDVERVRGISDRANNHPIVQVPLEDLRQMDPGQMFLGGPPMLYAVVGYRAVQFQPTAATGLWAVSTSAADTAGPAVFVQTHTTGGYNYADTKALNGLTRVAIGATVRTDHEEVTKFYLSVAAAGFVSLFTSATVGTELVRLEPGQTSQHYLTVEWFPVPTVDTTVYLDYTRTVPDLVQDFDEPILPPDYHYLLAVGARVKEYELLDDDRLAVARAEYVRGVAGLRSFILNDGDSIQSLRPRAGVRWNRLGWNYPAERG